MGNARVLQVEAVGGFVEDHNAGLGTDFPRQQDLLDVAARQLGDRGLLGRRADVVLADLLAGMAVDELPVADAAAPIGRLADLLQHQICGDGERADGAFAHPLVGDIADAALAPLGHAIGGNVGVAELEAARGGRPLPRQQFSQMLLAVAVNAGDAEDLAGPEIETYIPEGTFAAAGLGLQAAGAEPRRAAAIHGAVAVGFSTAAGQNLRIPFMFGTGAEHHADDLVGNLRLAHRPAPLGRNLADHATEAQHGDAVAEFVRFH